MSKLIFLDTEYSSVTHELAQLSYILLQNGQTTCKNFYFCVHEMDEGAYRIHHLSKEWLDENGVAYTDRHIKEQKPTYEELKDWYQVEDPDTGKTGFLYKSYVNK